MSVIKAPGVPLAMTFFAILMGVGGTIIGIAALADSSSAANFVSGAEDFGTSWAGRNLGLGLAMLVGVAMRHAAGYAAAFAGAICRELSDVLVEFNIAFCVIMLVEIGCLAWCARVAVAPPTGQPVGGGSQT